MDAVLLFFYFKIHKFNPLSIYFFIHNIKFKNYVPTLVILRLFIPLYLFCQENWPINSKTHVILYLHTVMSPNFLVYINLPILISKHIKQHTKPGQFLLSKKRDTISQQRNSFKKIQNCCHAAPVLICTWIWKNQFGKI